MKIRLQKTFAATRFRDPPMIVVAARPGELATSCLASVESRCRNPPVLWCLSVTHQTHLPLFFLARPSPGGGEGDAKAAPHNIEALVELLRAQVTHTPASRRCALRRPRSRVLLSSPLFQVTLPERSVDGPFSFAIDHCFAVKGQGTVITGTALGGSIKVGQDIEFPLLKVRWAHCAHCFSFFFFLFVFSSFYFHHTDSACPFLSRHSSASMALSWPILPYTLLLSPPVLPPI